MAKKKASKKTAKKTAKKKMTGMSKGQIIIESIATIEHSLAIIRETLETADRNDLINFGEPCGWPD